MALIETDTGRIFADHFPHKVYHRARWHEDWAEVKYLYADQIHAGNGRDPSQATLSWRFGMGLQNDAGEFGQYQKLDLTNHYVKIEVEQEEGNRPIKWYGVVVEQAEDRKGALLGEGGGRILTGENGFVANGLEMLLDQTVLTRSHVLKKASGAPGDEDKVYVLKRALTFNKPNHFADHGNRTSAKGPDGVYLFSEDLGSDTSLGGSPQQQSEFWTTKDIVEYLLHYESPRAIDDTTYITWELGDDAEHVLPDWDRPQIEAEGRTIFTILNQLCDPRRMLGWACTVNEEDEEETVQIQVFSFNKDIIVLPSGALQLENMQTIELDFDRAVDVGRAMLKRSSSHVVEQVRVLGARKRAIFTVSTYDGTLVKDWKDEDQAAYSAGPGGIEDLDLDLKVWRRDEFRAADRFERVFSWFRMPKTWDGRVADGRGGIWGKFFPDDDDGNAETWYMPDLRFSRHLSKEFFDYAPDQSPEEELLPVVLMKTDYPDGTRYENVDKIGRQGGSERAGNEGGRVWSCSVRMQHGAPGIVLHVSGGHQYIIAKGAFAPADGDEEPLLNYSDNLLATVMMELDSQVEVLYPPQDEILGQPQDIARIVTIDLGDRSERARLDWVAAGTVDHHVDGIPQTSSHAGTYVRDDREWMRDLARLCYDWYSVPRQAFRFDFRQISNLLEVGQLITKVGSGATEEEVNSVVTAVTWDLVGGRTEVTTSFAEIDPLQFVTGRHSYAGRASQSTRGNRGA